MIISFDFESKRTMSENVLYEILLEMLLHVHNLQT